jgi:hypothetical protein
MRHSHAFALLTFLSTAAVSLHARADVPPPDDWKYVRYSFVVKGLAVTPDRMLFAYPCGTSSGVPTREHQKIADGVPIPVGRRGGSCTIYSIDKASYEAFAKDHKSPGMDSSDPAVEALAEKSLKCEGAPTPRFELRTEDERNALVETLEVTKLDATSCVLTSKGDGSTPATGSTANGTVPKGRPASSKSGCATAGSSAVGLGMLAFVCAALLGARRRRA